MVYITLIKIISMIKSNENSTIQQIIGGIGLIQI